MTSIAFVEQPSTGSELLNYEFTDPATGRQFNVRVFDRPNSLEVAAGATLGTEGVLRYFLEEMQPTGRMVRGEMCEEGRAIENWREISKSPSKANAAVSAASVDGWAGVFSGGGLGLRTIFYNSLEACGRQIENALHSDTWVISEEPIRRHVHAENCTLSFEAKAAIAIAKNSEARIVPHALSLVVPKCTPREAVTLDIDERGVFRLEVTDGQYEYPKSVRLLLIFSPTGEVLPRSFSRGTWEDLADEIAGGPVARYDGPAGIARGFPAYGQEFCPQPAKPDRIARSEVLHYQGGTSNKIYCDLVVDDTHWLIWGRFDKGKLACKPAGGSFAASTKLSEKRSEGYDRVDGDDVPDLWTRALAAVDAKKAKGGSR